MNNALKKYVNFNVEYTAAKMERASLWNDTESCFTYELEKRLFIRLMERAEFLGFHPNSKWVTDRGLKFRRRITELTGKRD